MLPRTTIYVLFGYCHSVQASIVQSPVESVSTCPARTINYITQSLQPLCLTSSRTAAVTSSTTRSSETTQAYIDAASPPDASIDLDRNSTDIVPPPEIVVTIPTSASLYVSVSSTQVSATNPIATQALISLEDIEEDSVLEDGKFLSFEDWKRQNLHKAGQSEHVGSASRPDIQEPRKRPGGVSNALDSLGDDAEIDLDFSGIMPNGPDQLLNTVSAEGTRAPDEDPKQRTNRRSKDAGTTCKERFNYASFDCAANVLKTNAEAKSPNTILVENKDSYMLNVCSAKEKFIILELCNDILIDTMVLANFEFFSSTFRQFRVSVSDRYPVKKDKWKLLGTYEASNTRGIQAFLVEDPVIWARYVRIDFDTHYGSEFYCPVSLVRVHGTTMMDEYKNDMESNIDDDVEEEVETQPAKGFTDTDDHARMQAQDIVDIEAKHDSDFMNVSLNTADTRNDIPAQDSGVVVKHSQASSTSAMTASLLSDALSSVMLAAPQTSSICLPHEAPLPTASETRTNLEISSTTTASGTMHNRESAREVTIIGESTTPSPILETSTQTSVTTKATLVQSVLPPHPANSSTTISVSSIVPDPSSVNENKPEVVYDTASKPSMTDRSKSSSSITPPIPAPSMQESFYKSVQKRLQQLEANSSLSLQYIEDQSRALRDAFKRVEQRQIAKTTIFLETLNLTVLNELREFRYQYDQLWQSTVIELDFQRERYEKDNQALNARLGILADEVIFQRRMGILQMCLILVCLVLVLFSRGAINNYLELPMVQNMLTKSHKSRWLNLSMSSPRDRRPSVARTRSAMQLENTGVTNKGHRRMRSEESLTDVQSGPEIYAPLTPVSFDENVDIDVYKHGSPGTEVGSEQDTQVSEPEPDLSEQLRSTSSLPDLRAVSHGLGVSAIDEDDTDMAVQDPTGSNLLSTGASHGSPGISVT